MFIKQSLNLYFYTQQLAKQLGFWIADRIHTESKNGSQQSGVFQKTALIYKIIWNLSWSKVLCSVSGEHLCVSPRCIKPAIWSTSASPTNFQWAPCCCHPSTCQGTGPDGSPGILSPLRWRSIINVTSRLLLHKLPSLSLKQFPSSLQQQQQQCLKHLRALATLLTLTVLPLTACQQVIY